ncbi:MAG: hypothetical protein RIC55_13665 [Pirellulaceae bacterium]
MIAFFGMPGHLELLILGAMLLCAVGVPLGILVVILLVVRSSGAARPHSGANLTICPDCGQAISRLAESCPHCGRPTKVPADNQS